jgi:hypothetical protein
MTRAGKSIFYFSFWVLMCGIFLMFVPEFSLSFMNMVLADYIIVRLFGMILIFLFVYYIIAGRNPAFWPFYQATIFTRYTALLSVIIFVIIGIAKPYVIGFVIVDAIGATWTLFALIKDKKEGLCR